LRLALGSININRRMTLNKKLTIRSTLTLAALITVAPAVMAQDADADEGLHVLGRLGLEHDSNVLRVPSAANPQSDTAWTAGIGLQYNKRFGLQRVRADIEGDTWRYQHHSDLNFNTINYALAWDWSVTPRFHGTVSADRRQYREVTTDPAGANLIGRRTERNELAEGVFEIDGPWRALAGVSHYRTESSQPGSWDASPDISFGQVGVGYEAASGSSVTARFKRGDGKYHDPTFATFAALDTDFRETEEELAVRWAYTGKTTVEGRIAHLKREHSNAPALDFGGMVGGINVAWDITGKTRLIAGWMHDLSATGLVTGGHVTSDRFFLAPVWHATAKTSFNLRYDHTKRDWQDIPATAPFTSRSETVESLQAGVDWQALRTIGLSAYIRQERQRANFNTVDTGYRATVYGILAKANF
jgi:exopolysaccharide biosynthesis operon protein EpsL